MKMHDSTRHLQMDEPKVPPLTEKDLAELKGRYADSIDPTRYVIVSPFSRLFCLYYIPADGHFIMNEVPPSSMFKRRAEALAVAKVLERHRKRGLPRTLQVLKVRKTKRGVRILDLVVDPWHTKKKWKPVFRRYERDCSRRGEK